jgi:tRNA threonylcarbamoyl adenosine modification protein YjeE
MPARSSHHTLSLRSESEAQTMAIARTIAGELRGGQVIALEGPLGSGKTCFVRGLAAGLGLDSKSVSSPTFVICQEYDRPRSADRRDSQAMLIPLVHIDAYRLSGPEDLETIGWSEMLEARDTVIAVEWPSRIAAALPTDRIEVTFEHTGEHSRLLTISGLAGGAMERLKSLGNASGAASTAAAVCRICGKPVPAGATTLPFCSDRCRLADLNRWFNEGYRTSREIQMDDELSE